MTTILGISAFYHDTAACVVVDGDIVAAAQESVSRERSTTRASRAWRCSIACEVNQRVADIGYVVFYEKPVQKLERLLETYLAFAPSGLRSFGMAMTVFLKEKMRLPSGIREGLAAILTSRDGVVVAS